MTTATHTPTPWKVNYAQEINGTFKAEILPGINEHQAVAYTWGATLDQTLSNAAFIVRAVNCHEELLNACEWAYEFIAHDVRCRGKNDCDCGAGEVKTKLMQALAKSEGK